ncbi:MAG TPA: right-handed parallel beta-helix repeat-containing protein, partial [Allocoleopsis sp.]
STTDYAIGIDTTSMWFSVDTNANSHRFSFYQATNNVANLNRLGIDLYAADLPLVTRRHDTFTSGTYSGVGRWGLFMEPGAITIGKPTGAGKNFKVSNYNADSTKSDLLTVNESGDLTLSGNFLGTLTVITVSGEKKYILDASGTTDVSATINSIISGLPSTGGTLRFSVGKFLLDDPITIDEKNFITIEGSSGYRDLGNYPSTPEYMSGSTLFQVSPTNYCGIFVGYHTNDLSALISGINLRNFSMSGATSSALQQNAIWFDTNSDATVIDNITIANFTGIAICMRSPDSAKISKIHAFTNGGGILIDGGIYLSVSQCTIGAYPTITALTNSWRPFTTVYSEITYGTGLASVLGCNLVLLGVTRFTVSNNTFTVPAWCSVNINNGCLRGLINNNVIKSSFIGGIMIRTASNNLEFNSNQIDFDLAGADPHSRALSFGGIYVTGSDNLLFNGNNMYLNAVSAARWIYVDDSENFQLINNLLNGQSSTEKVYFTSSTLSSYNVRNITASEFVDLNTATNSTANRHILLDSSILNNEGKQLKINGSGDSTIGFYNSSSFTANSSTWFIGRNYNSVGSSNLGITNNSTGNVTIYRSDGTIDFPQTSQVSTTDNAITGVEGTINTQGDLVLYNGTKNTVVFRGVGIAAPSLTNRSVGTKLVLYPNTTASTTDYAIGMNTTSMWFSV